VLSYPCCLPGPSWAGPGGHSPNPTRRGHIQHPARCFGPLRQVRTVSTKKILSIKLIFISLLFSLLFYKFIIYILSFLKNCLDFSKIHYITISGLGLREPNVYPASSCWAPSHTPAPAVSYPFATHNAPGKPLNCSCLKLLVPKRQFAPTVSYPPAKNMQSTKLVSEL
jgi:hypothetical protein